MTMPHTLLISVEARVRVERLSRHCREMNPNKVVPIGTT